MSATSPPEATEASSPSFEAPERYMVVNNMDDVFEDAPPPQADPYTTQLRLVLQPWIVHFKSPGYIKVEMMSMLGDVCKKMLRRTIKEPEVRYVLRLPPALAFCLCPALN